VQRHFEGDRVADVSYAFYRVPQPLIIVVVNNSSHTVCVSTLGSQISQVGKCDQDIKRRSSVASAIVGKLGRIWRSCNISTKTKIKVYESLVVREESKILSTEMRWLRKILGVSMLQKVRSETVMNILEQEDRQNPKKTYMVRSREKDGR